MLHACNPEPSRILLKRPDFRLCLVLVFELTGFVFYHGKVQYQRCFVCGSFVSRLSRVVRKAPTAALYWSSGIFPNCR